jgi:predicted transcriptional regulator of viral defense system
MSNRTNSIVNLFNENQGIVKVSELHHLGVSQYEISKLCKEGVIECIERGIYRLSQLPISQYEDYTLISLKVKNAVFCLITALDFHDLTLQIPKFIFVAVSKKTYKPKITYPPVQYIVYSDELLNTGTLTISKPGSNFKIFNREKTLIDCLVFKDLLWGEVIADAVLKYLDYPEKNNRNMLEEYAKKFGVLEDLNYWLKAYPEYCNK